MARFTAHARRNAIAYLALFVALGGTSYAAVALPRHSVGKKHLKANAVVTGKVRNGTLLPADFRGGALPAGPKGGRGEKGDKGPQGEKGDKGAQGVAGPIGPAGSAGPYPTVLPSGETLLGVFGDIGHADATGERFGTPITFPIPLASAPTVHFVEKDTTAPAECSGTAAAPAAAPGHLCLYQAQAVNVLSEAWEDPVTGNSGGAIRPWGAQTVGVAAVAGAYNSSGTWAVTAP